MDGLITFWGVQHSLIDEANPLMKELFSIHPYAFLGFKIILSLLLLFLGIIKFEFISRLVWASLSVATILYTGVLIYHAYWLFLL
ncbi:DUF5658 family protein [Guptibacillus algicola]|uniref:DUF5658 family protein n=1 Tax=Guptibacillus algicola TaxID=225844 RepID=UPI0021E52D77|nr:DUF5658 family protein [Alkalihalobacillus algicola]